MPSTLTHPALYWTALVIGYDAHGDVQRYYETFLDSEADAWARVAKLRAELEALGYTCIRTFIEAVR